MGTKWCGNGCGTGAPFVGGDTPYCGSAPSWCDETIEWCGANTAWGTNFTGGIHTVLLTGADCEAEYGLVGDISTQYPVTDIEVRTVVLGGLWGDWESLSPTDTIIGPADSVSIGIATFCATQYKGIDDCGTIISTILGPTITCTDCGGGDAISGPDSIASCDATAQYIFNVTVEGTPIWSVSGNVGSGGGIDQDGLLTIGTGCDGLYTVVVSLGCCGWTKVVTTIDPVPDFPVMILPVSPSCAGRVLNLPLTDIDCFSANYDLNIILQGAIGTPYYDNGFNMKLNAANDLATISENGILTLDGCPDGTIFPPWIDFWYCDACGCGYKILNLSDCPDGCDCSTCDCEDTEAGCYASCCGWTESGTFGEMDASDTKQFTCSGGGDWSITGADATIDQTGLVTTGASSCGTIVITNSICGDKEVRVQNNSHWEEVDSCQTLLGETPLPCGIFCHNNSFEIIGAIRYHICHNPTSDPIDGQCSDPSGKYNGGLICLVRTFEWRCN